ncbi:MAG: flagellar type III secretion system protein FlhB [Rhodocyclaceae bacterium]|nr:flagellar type III secretion system protein FlhB [Rhodocyclaceae bacterium]
MADESDLERTEPASSRRLEQAREEGQVPHSRELAAFVVMLAGVGGLWATGSWIAQHARDIVVRGLSFGRDAAFDDHVLSGTLASLGLEAMTLMAPLLLLVVAGTLITPFLLGGWIFTAKTMTLDLTRLDPVKGFGRMFSMHGMGELVKAVLKAILIGALISWLIWREGGALLDLPGLEVGTALAGFVRLLFLSGFAVLVGMAAVAAIDVPFQLWQYYSRLRMTREELRQELKETEGDPQLKARIRSQQREMARKRMMSEVPKADVVVTNPTRFAVALKYDAGRMGAPQVVAKGMNLVAQRIRDLATEHAVPILEAPPLARALHRHVEVGDQVPASLYTAVAEVMAYVYQLQRFATGDGPVPVLPSDIVIPPDLDPGVPD